MTLAISALLLAMLAMAAPTQASTTESAQADTCLDPSVNLQAAFLDDGQTDSWFSVAADVNEVCIGPFYEPCDYGTSDGEPCCFAYNPAAIIACNVLG